MFVEEARTPAPRVMSIVASTMVDKRMVHTP
jgi:hypothetical protein